MTDKPIIFSAQMIRAIIREIERPGSGKTQTRRVLKPQPVCDLMNGIIRHPQWPVGCGYPGDIFANKIANGSFTYWVNYAPGDRLWVKEAWRCMDRQDADSGSQIAAKCLDAGYHRPWSPIQFEADKLRVNWIADPHTFGKSPGRYRHARFMPRWASRLTLPVTDVRVQRLQDISNEDAIAEGVGHYVLGAGFITDQELRSDPGYSIHLSPKHGFEAIWDSIHSEPKPIYRGNRISHYVSYPFRGNSRVEEYRGKRHIITANPWVTAISFTPHLCNIDQMGGRREHRSE